MEGAPEIHQPAVYSLLLGYYLGDGHVGAYARTWAMRISLDAAYPGLVDECRAAIKRWRASVGSPSAVTQSIDVSSSTATGSAGREYFPQAGPGRKHNRPIVLAAWQREIVDLDPRPFLRGLIMSDGCRCMNRFKTRLPSGRVAEYAYPRYFFSNLSADIRGLFCEYCERLGIRWTQPNHRNISVSHRHSVALLDSFIGPKR